MTLNECIQFANAHPLCHLATAVNNQPYVRIIGLWFADETGFYYQSATMKDLSAQLTANPNTELCFYKHEGMIGTMLRIQGTVELLDDIFWKTKAVEDRPFLKTMGLSAESPGLFLFRIAHGKAHFWTMDNNMKPKEYLEF
jgi:uncharacterized pyridoxamine 5'-phosphate oxidase family protein